MSWRIVAITKKSKLEYKMGYLVVRSDKTTKIHLNEISTLIIEDTSVALTASLLCALSKKKIKVIFCDEKRNPFAELVDYYGSHDTSGKLREQIKWKEITKQLIWTEIVRNKISQQSQHLKILKLEQHLLLHNYAQEIENNDTTNREAHAAKVYFNALFGMEFTRAADTLLNAVLNYGYSIILSSFNREIVAAGYMTQFGIFHDNMFNPFNLASDLMEPFRILIDRRVMEMELKEELDHNTKMELVDVLNRQVLIEGKLQYINNAIRIYCKSIFEALRQDDISEIKFYQI